MDRTQVYITSYRILRAAGLTHEATLAMQGNWAKESLHDAFRKQGDLSEAAVPSHEYTAAVTSGAISRDRFSSDDIGYGLAQWTYWNKITKRGRKQNLYDFWKTSGKALDDVTMQTEFAVWELKHDYASVYEELKKSHNLYYCTDLICKRYEQPAYNNVQDRYEAAMKIGAVLANRETQAKLDEPEVERFWPPRMICENMNGPDVEVAQALLKARGYTLSGSAGVFSASTRKAVEKFQRENPPLDIDGVIGPMTWTELLRR